jgi:hypothetical protein
MSSYNVTVRSIRAQMRETECALHTGCSIQAREQKNNSLSICLTCSYAHTFHSKVDELEKQLATLRDAVQGHHPAVIVASLSTDVVGAASASHGTGLTSHFPPQLSQSPYTTNGSPFGVNPNALQGGSRPPAKSIRAIESMALTLEEIDSLFNL